MLDIKVLLHQELYLMMVLKLLCRIQNVMIYTGISKIDIPDSKRIPRLTSYQKLGGQNSFISICTSLLLRFTIITS